MSVNRYTSLTPSQFNPLSLEEIMLVPSMQRKRHDDTVKGLEEIRAKLANVDPEDKYFEEAVKLREQLNNKLTSQVENINKEGFNPNSTGQFLAMNREYQDLMSPTGKLGMINQEKKNTQAYIENYRKEGLALGLTPEQMQPWIDAAIAKRNNELPLYDEKGRTIGLKIDKNVVKAQDIFKDFAEHATRLGMSSTARGNISAGIQVAPNGEFTYVNTTGWDSEKGDNAKQIQDALDFMNSRLNDPNSDYAKYYDYIGQDKESIAKALQEQSGIYKKDVDNYKTQHQISNLIDNRPREGNGDGDDEEFKDPREYSNADETTPLGDDYEKIRDEAQAVLNNPKSTKVERIEATKKLDLIDDVKEELLTNDKEFVKITSEINNKIQNSGLNKTLQQQIENAPFINASFAGISGRNRTIYLGNKLVVVTSEELNKIKSMENLFNKHQKRKIEKINEAISTRGLERTVFTKDMKPAERNAFHENVKDAITSDTSKPTTANYIDADGKSSKINLNESLKQKTINLFNTSESKNIVSAKPSKQGNSVGMLITFKPNAGSKLNGDDWNDEVSFDGNQAVEMFVPITELRDNMTGLKHTTNRVYNSLSPGLKREFDKMVYGSNLGATTNKTRLGSLAEPANNYFRGKYSDDTKIDFLQKGKLNNKVIIPYIINKDNKQTPMKWNDVVDYNRLNDSSYMNRFSNLSIDNNIEFSYANAKGVDINQLPKLSNGQLDYMSMLNYLKYKELTLPNTQDIIEFSNLTD